MPGAERFLIENQLVLASFAKGPEKLDYGTFPAGKGMGREGGGAQWSRKDRRGWRGRGQTRRRRNGMGSSRKGDQGGRKEKGGGEGGGDQEKEGDRLIGNSPPFVFSHRRCVRDPRLLSRRRRSPNPTPMAASADRFTLRGENNMKLNLIRACWRAQNGLSH